MLGSVNRGDMLRARLALGLFTPAIAWLVHLVGASLISEWGCLSGFHQSAWLGISAVIWGLLVITVFALFVAGIATWSVWQVDRYHQNDSSIDSVDDELNVFLAETGKISGLLFVTIILAESIPILFFLSGC